jgi:glutathione S-transferase
MLTVHHLENSRSHRIVWLLEELGVDYQITRYGRDKETGLAPPELLEVHPLGKAPVITDGDKTYTYWLHYAEGTFASLMMLSLVMARIEDAPLPFFLKPVAKGIAGKVRDGYLDPNVKRNLEFMEWTLSESKWFCGDRFSAADVQMSFPLEAAEVRTDLSNAYPQLAAFLVEIRERPAYKAALDKGGHYELMSINK